MTVFQGKDGAIAGAASVNSLRGGARITHVCPPIMRFQSGYLIQVAPTAAADDPYLVGPLLASSTPALDDLGYGELQIETQPLKPDDKPLYLMAADPTCTHATTSCQTDRWLRRCGTRPPTT